MQSLLLSWSAGNRPILNLDPDFVSDSASDLLCSLGQITLPPSVKADDNWSKAPSLIGVCNRSLKWGEVFKKPTETEGQRKSALLMPERGMDTASRLDHECVWEHYPGWEYVVLERRVILAFSHVPSNLPPLPCSLMSFEDLKRIFELWSVLLLLLRFSYFNTAESFLIWKSTIQVNKHISAFSEERKTIGSF